MLPFANRLALIAVLVGLAFDQTSAQAACTGTDNGPCLDTEYCNGSVCTTCPSDDSGCGSPLTWNTTDSAICSAQGNCIETCFACMDFVACGAADCTTPNFFMTYGNDCCAAGGGTGAYDDWGLHFDSGSLSVTTGSGADDGKLIISYDMYTGLPNANHILKTFLKDSACDGPAGSFVALVDNATHTSTDPASGLLDAFSGAADTNSTFGTRTIEHKIILAEIASSPDFVATAEGGTLSICSRVTLTDTASNMMVSFSQAYMDLSTSLDNVTFSITTSAEGLETENLGSTTFSRGYNVTPCFCFDSDTACDANQEAVILQQNGELEVCLVPTASDIEIVSFDMKVAQTPEAGGADRDVDIVLSGVQQVLTTVSNVVHTDGPDSLQAKKVVHRILGMFFEDDVPGDVTISGEADLSFISTRGRRRTEKVPVDLSPLFRRVQAGKENVFNDAAPASTADSQSEYTLQVQLEKAKGGFNAVDDTDLKADNPTDNAGWPGLKDEDPKDESGASLVFSFVALVSSMLSASMTLIF